MSKVIIATLIIGLAGGVYAAEFSDLEVKAADLKAVASASSPDIHAKMIEDGSKDITKQLQDALIELSQVLEYAQGRQETAHRLLVCADNTGNYTLKDTAGAILNRSMVLQRALQAEQASLIEAAREGGARFEQEILVAKAMANVCRTELNNDKWVVTEHISCVFEKFQKENQEIGNTMREDIKRVFHSLP